MPRKSQSVHVTRRWDDDAYGDPLPLPQTTRNIRPRFRLGADSRNSSNLRPQPRSRLEQGFSQASVIIDHPIIDVMPSTWPNTNTSMVEFSSEGQRVTLERHVKKRRSSHSARVKAKRLSFPSAEEATEAQPSYSIEESSSGQNVEMNNVGAHASSSSHPSAGRRGHSAVSSPSLAKILHVGNVEMQRTRKSSSTSPTSTTPTVAASTLPFTSVEDAASPSSPIRPAEADPEPLGEYTCPICFYPPRNATLTPCGHICCGSCLFTAVRSTMQRAALVRTEGSVARCPVCRANIPGWDGKGGGVIGLRPRVVMSL